MFVISVTMPDESMTMPDESATTSDEGVVTSDEGVVTSDESVAVSDESSTTYDASVAMPDESVAISDDSLTGTDKSLTISDKSDTIVVVIDSIGMPAVSLVSSITPKPDGSGWNTVHAYRTGRNLLSVTVDDLAEITYLKTNGESATVKGYDIHLPAGMYKVSGSYKPGYSSGVYVYGFGVNADGVITAKSSVNPVVDDEVDTDTFILNEGDRLFLYNGALKQTLGTTKTKFGMVNLGIYTINIDTTYEDCNLMTLTAELPETVYGGTLNWSTGVLTSTLDKDGNELSEHKVFQLPTHQLDMLYGYNAVWSDCGSTSLEYVVDDELHESLTDTIDYDELNELRKNGWSWRSSPGVSSSLDIDIIFNNCVSFDKTVTSDV